MWTDWYGGVGSLVFEFWIQIGFFANHQIEYSVTLHDS